MAAAHRARLARGVSLIEALVALAVMTFGMIAYVGLQSTLRQTGDVARQRSEAVRIAQQAVEQWRAYVATGEVADEVDYTDIDSLPPESADSTDANTTFTLTRTVVDAAADAASAPAAPRMKTLVVDVQWLARDGTEPQSVRLSTTITAVPPELAGTLRLARTGAPLGGPAGRHPAIPIEAVDEGSTSRFTPPQPDGGTVSWVFDDATGVITQICSTTIDCTAVTAFLLRGHVRFATGSAQPAGADAEVPPSAALPVQVVVERTHPSVLSVACHEQQDASAVRYFCAVPVDPADTPPRWSGRSRVLGLPLAASIADATDTAYRVCRYTPYRDHRAVGSGTPPMRNQDHPLDYGAPVPDASKRGVDGPLLNQNFLVIRAGAAGTPFDCPDDDAATAYVDGTTWHHQPSL